MQELKEALRNASKVLFDIEVEPELDRPDEKFGDYSTNLAMQLGKRLNKNPNQLAVALAGKLNQEPGVKEVSIAGPGFINIRLSDERLAQVALSATDLPQPLAGQEILVEFGDPNPFKEMHIGHLYSYIVGDSICRLLEAQGATVRRLSYHGDVGLHVAQAIWGIQKSGVKPTEKKSSLISHIGKYYQEGARAYAESPEVKKEIEVINKQVYERGNPKINELYDWAKKESFREFKAVLDDLNIRTDDRYMESDATEIGLHLVRANTGGIFKESQGAVIYEGEKAGLHTRVFITSKGLPTYETKDLGLVHLKDKDYPNASRSLIITAHEQSEYFKVMLAALKELDEELANKTSHMYHGFVKLSTGKMSSRKGEVFTAIKLMVDVQMKARDIYKKDNLAVEMAAIKYGFLKHRLGGDIIYDVSESVSLEGNSGPYLQYAHARACNILAKANFEVSTSQIKDLDGSERSLARKICEYPEVIQRAAGEFLPSHVANYLYELAQSFNRFYEKSRVVGNEREKTRLILVNAYAEVLKNGLGLLNIEAPHKL